MEKTNKINPIKSKAFYIIIIFFIMFITDSPIFQINSNPIYNRISQIVLLLVGVITFIVYLLRNRFIVINKNFKLLIIIIIFLMVSWVLNLDLKLVIPIKIATLIFGYFIIQLIDSNKFVEYFIRIMLIISVYSLIVFFLRDSLIQLTFLPTMTTHKGLKLMLLGLSNLPMSISSTRNWGPFWEPGAFQIYLNLALIMVLYSKKLSNMKILIYSSIIIFTIFTLLSTAGIITLAVISISYMFSSSKNNKSIILKVIILLFIFIVGYYLIIEEGLLQDIIFDKFDTDSGEARLDTIKHGLQAWFAKPFFGHGSNYINAMYGFSGYEFSVTNTIIINFVAFGMFFGLYFIGNLKGFVDSLKTSLISRYLLYAGMIALLSGSNLIYSPTIAIIMYLRVNKKPKEYM